MNLLCRWEIILICLWMHVGFVPGMFYKDGTLGRLSREDVLVLKDEQSPKCFTRSEHDFTCFFETTHNKTYNLFYKLESDPEKRCELSVERTEEGTFLHICSFPDSDVLFFIDIHLKVVEGNGNTLYERTVCVEDNCLLDPLFNVALHENGQVGQLQISWQTTATKYMTNRHRIRYSSNGLREKTVKEVTILESLIPGEVVEVQVAVKCSFNEDTGHWSSWSQPARAVVPQSADDISLMCYTSDLQTVVCRWNGSKYGVEKQYTLFYQMGLSEALSWTNWTECVPERNLTDLCSFQGDKTRKVRVKLSSSPAPLSRTFYTQEFTLNNSIKTFPPSDLQKHMENDRLCLTWEAPLPPLFAHLQYEVTYKIREWETWMTANVKGPKTDTCLKVPSGHEYNVRIRAKPTGSIYSGYWSDWSDVLTGDTPTDLGKLFMLCLPVLMLIIVIILISLFTKCLSKLKLYVWPPVPNLNKVLQGYVTEMNRQKWNPAITTKQCSDETYSSVVEVMSEVEVSGLGKPSEISTKLLSPERSLSCTEQVHLSPGSEVFPDYVTLNKDSIILQPGRNKSDEEDPVVTVDLFQKSVSSCSEGSDCIEHCEGINFLNHCYLNMTEHADRFCMQKGTAGRVPGNLYTNLPCSKEPFSNCALPTLSSREHCSHS
uniref:thrombopoietin receptor isoform X2 n=1 Tax=Scatophagus argus TaxID=75038 RepID=UPI001ED7E48A|nr:thrombopoietin receptor isoform X2 [Scatophagus argus]